MTEILLGQVYTKKGNVIGVYVGYRTGQKVYVVYPTSASSVVPNRKIIPRSHLCVGYVAEVITERPDSRYIPYFNSDLLCCLDWYPKLSKEEILRLNSHDTLQNYLFYQLK